MQSGHQNRSSILRVLSDKIKLLLLTVLIGIGAGLAAILANQVSVKWALVILLAFTAPAVILLVNNLRKLLLIAVTIDIPLGLDIAINNQDWHLGGPSGFIISLMTVALVIGYAIWIVEKEPKPRFFSSVTIPALLFLFMVVVSLFQSVNLQLSLFGIFLQVQFFLMYFYLANHIRSWQDLRLVITVAAIGLLLQAALMLLQYFTGISLSFGAVSSYAYELGVSAGATGSRVGGTIGAPNSAAAYLVSTLLFVFSAYLSDRLVNKFLAILACSLGIIALVATSSRTAWGSLVLAIIVLLSQIIWTKAGKKAFWIIVVGALLIGAFFGEQIWARLEASFSDNTRPELAYMARNIIRAHPLGVGENNYDQIMSDKYAHPNWVGHELLPVHNKYLLIWAETGILGLAAFGLLLIATAWQARRWFFQTNLPPHLLIPTAGLLSAFLGYAFHMSMEGFSSRANGQILWFLVAITVALNQLIFCPKREAEQQDMMPSAKES